MLPHRTFIATYHITVVMHEIAIIFQKNFKILKKLYKKLYFFLLKLSNSTYERIFLRFENNTLLRHC